MTSMHLYPRRRNVAAQVANDLKTVTYATPPMEGRRKKEEETFQYYYVNKIEQSSPFSVYFIKLSIYFKAHTKVVAILISTLSYQFMQNVFGSLHYQYMQNVRFPLPVQVRGTLKAIIN